jgi:hypothetical protein
MTRSMDFVNKTCTGARPPLASRQSPAGHRFQVAFQIIMAWLSRICVWSASLLEVVDRARGGEGPVRLGARSSSPIDPVRC